MPSQNFQLRRRVRAGWGNCRTFFFIIRTSKTSAIWGLGSCSSVVPVPGRKKRLVVVVPCLNETVSPCGTFEMLGHSPEVADVVVVVVVVAPIVKKRTIKRRRMTKKIAKGEIKASNNSDTRITLRCCTRTWAARLFVFLLFLVSAPVSRS
jgi:hypothetical protein